MDQLEDMDEELAKARREAGGHGRDPDRDKDGIDIYKYRRRYRLFKAILLGASLAGLTAIILAMVNGQKNPCERVRAYLCKKDPAGFQCKSYVSIVDESEHEGAPEMRSQIRAQCVSKIERLKEEEGVELK